VRFVSHRGKPIGKMTRKSRNFKTLSFLNQLSEIKKREKEFRMRYKKGKGIPVMRIRSRKEKEMRMEK